MMKRDKIYVRASVRESERYSELKIETTTYRENIRKIFLQKIDSHNRSYWLRGLGMTTVISYFSFQRTTLVLAFLTSTTSCFVPRFLYFPSRWHGWGRIDRVTRCRARLVMPPSRLCVLSRQVSPGNVTGRQKETSRK